MIFDGIPFAEYLRRSGAGIREKALRPFIEYLEKKLSARLIYDSRNIPFGRADLIEPLRLAALLKKAGVIKNFGQSLRYADEPQLKSWYATCNDKTANQVGGSAWESDSDALFATLAEGLERYLWYTQEDYFLFPKRATISQIKNFGPCITPEEITGFSHKQRLDHPERVLRPDAEYLWIQGTSLVNGRRVYLCAQVVSGIRPYNFTGGVKEPLIRQQITNGLATWPTKAGARIAGALEVIERDAYMIMWLNQMTLPRISLTSLRARYPELERVFATCDRYRLKPYVIPMLTDAPSHAIAVVLEDMSGVPPRFAMGLKAHRSLPQAIEKATTEALRARRGYRLWSDAGNTLDTGVPAHEIGHRERLHYWGVPAHAKKLEFLIQGPEIEIETREWDNDTEDEHLRRVIRFCKEKNFECVAVSLTTSAKNPTLLHVEMVVIPQLQPTYLIEQMRAFGGTRLHDVPKTFGYKPLERPFADAPHPFS